MNLKVLKQDFVRDLGRVYSPQEAESIFFLVVEQLTGWSRTTVLLGQDAEMADTQQASFETVKRDLLAGKPVQYILGTADFYGMTFKVNSEVLIPRPETEELVHWILDYTKAQPVKTLLDIGTGSGCIAIALKKHLLLTEVSALDISTGAVATAKANAALNGVAIHFLQEDILGFSSADRFDVIVSNPPYIKEVEKLTMHAHVLLHEPHTALFVADDNPLVFYKAIADFAALQLVPGGALFLEINEALGRETMEMLKGKGFEALELRQDMQGKDRMIYCRRASSVGETG